MREAVIVSTARTPIGKAFRGAFNDTHGATLASHVIRHAVERSGLDPAEIEDVVLGCADPEGATGGNIARVAAYRAGLPVTTGGTTINRFCSSGLQAISLAAQRVVVDGVPAVVAGGVESISLVQNFMNKHRYLGHNNWTLPITLTPYKDKKCSSKNPDGGGSFGLGCTRAPLAALYKRPLGVRWPDPAVSIPDATTGPFHDFQPYVYWTGVSAGNNQGFHTFSFNTGKNGSNQNDHFMYALPMLAGNPFRQRLL